MFASVQKTLLNKEQMICIVLAQQAREDGISSSSCLQLFIACLHALYITVQGTNYPYLKGDQRFPDSCVCLCRWNPISSWSPWRS